MAEIIIDHCTLRVVRRGGWSWGPDPKRFVDDAVRVLPTLLARRLESLFSEEDDRTYEAPVRIRLAVRSSELTDAALTDDPLSASAPLTALPLDRRLEAALRSALEMSPLPSEASLQPASPASRFRPSQPGTREVSRRHAAMQRLLLARFDSNQLHRFVGAFALEEIEAWHAAFSTVPGTTHVMDTARADSVFEAVAAAILTCALPPDSGRAAFLRGRLIAATEVSVKSRIPLDDPRIWRALDHIVPVGKESSAAVESILLPQPVEQMPDSTALSSSPPLLMPLPPPALSGDSPPLSAVSQPADEWTTQIHSALPFLLLGVLTRIGYIGSLSATLEAARLTNSAHLFGAALAYKVLEPPVRGWRRLEADQHTAAVFAGSPHPISDEALVDFSRQVAPYTGLLDRLIRDSVALGRNPAQPVLLRRAESDQSSGFLVLDTAGCFPFAWLEDASGAALLLREMKVPVVIVSQEASGPPVLHELDLSGICFVTGVPPSRGEPWKPILQGPSRLGWTNHAFASSESVLRTARALQVSSEEADDLWDRLGVQRVAVPRAKLPELERSLTLAVSVALGILAWQLWKDRGRTSPQLTLERFHDLDARVRYTTDTVMVSLPRGRRHSELMEGGFLAEVPDVPWLKGRRVEFGWS